jgi:subtilisin family serine protease
VKRLLALLLALLVAAGAAAQPAVPRQETGAAAGADGADTRQVLVLLRLPPAHFRADRDYAGDWGDLADRSAQRRLAARIARERGLQLLDDWPVPSLGLDCFVMALPAELPLAQAIVALSGDPRVVWAQPMHEFQGRSAAAPADPLFSAQPAASAWHLAELHRVATGRRVNVAVIDSGVETSHPDLAGGIAIDEDFAGPAAPAGGDTHGTAVAGIIAARAGNGIGIAGVAPDARLLALRACWPSADGSTRCNSLTLAKALQFALGHQAQVVNLSLAGPQDRLLAELLVLLLARGVAVVAAADPAWPGGGFPASQPGVIAVVDDGATATATTAVPATAWKAPGRDVPTSLPGGRWGLVSGASFAAAHVSGLIALMRELKPNAAAPAVVRKIGGSVDACATLSRLAESCVCDCTAAALPPLGPIEAAR